MNRLEHLQLQRKDCLKAIHEILAGGQTVEIEGMRITRASLEQIRGMLNDIENELAVLMREANMKRRSRVRVVVPL